MAVRLNFTLRGTGPEDGVRPVVDFGTQSGRAPRADLLAASLPGDWGTADCEDCFLVFKLCYPPELLDQALSLTVRAPWIPGPQKARFGLPQPGCIKNAGSADGGSGGGDGNSSRAGGGAPLERRCWPQLASMDDVAVLSYSVNGSQKPLPMECVIQFGTLGCAMAWSSGAFGKLPSPAAPPASSGSAPPPSPGGSGGSDGADDGGAGSKGGPSVLGAAIGGTAGVPSPPTPDPLAVVTPQTPHRPDVAFDVRPGREVTLLPTVLGKGAFGRVVAGVYQGQPVAVKIIVLTIALDVARGLEYLHPTVVHRDLKPGNVLINKPGSSRVVAKLSDFGLSRLRSTVAPTAHPEAGTPEFMAPELFALDNNVVTHKADVYSFGVLLWAMLTGKRPWEAWDADPKRRPAAAELVKELMLVREQLKMTAHGGTAGETVTDACALATPFGPPVGAEQLEAGSSFATANNVWQFDETGTSVTTATSATRGIDGTAVSERMAAVAVETQKQ
ncbi:hypothetical protein GPECTOR_12g605 [Gonium pectorale]|uniref:Protein kinase domain-containing protein n=1 Tax=Gonium pectorale TaxID=33097 RepID=A0A150GPB0_GONPE|nr:hypothetical protein GPECTOR_12g605 [Gonium pectorale]|eukprot:KXZ51641.1 hypothetical protein GPECTOR_12g605 [Gonium pectorale]